LRPETERIGHMEMDCGGAFCGRLAQVSWAIFGSRTRCDT